MTKAAALLNVAQPALGLQIRQLEERLGTALLERHSRGVVATPSGQLLHEHAVTILAMFEKAEREVRALGHTGQESITLGITPSIMHLVGSDLIQAAKRDLLNIQFSLVEHPSMTIIRELESGDLDIALTYEVPDTPTIQKTAVQHEELLFVARAEKMPATEMMSIADVLSHDLVLANDRDPIRRMVDAAGAAARTSVKVVYEVQSLMATRQVVIDGLAASILPYGVVADELSSGTLASRRVEGAPFKRRLYIARPSRRGSFVNEEPVAKLLRAVIKQLALDLGELAAPIDQDRT